MSRSVKDSNGIWHLVAGASILKSDTFSGTTDVGGDVSLGFNISSGKIPVAIQTTPSSICTPRILSNGACYAHMEHYVSGTTPQFYASTEFTGTYWYIEI